MMTLGEAVQELTPTQAKHALRAYDADGRPNGQMSYATCALGSALGGDRRQGYKDPIWHRVGDAHRAHLDRMMRGSFWALIYAPPAHLTAISQTLGIQPEAGVVIEDAYESDSRAINGFGRSMLHIFLLLRAGDVDPDPVAMHSPEQPTLLSSPIPEEALV